MTQRSIFRDHPSAGHRDGRMRVVVEAIDANRPATTVVAANLQNETLK
jgi:hypothetical protein